jgi:N-carbamoyl-L-amino-acid hydrolase
VDQNLAKTDHGRLWEALHEMAQIGATPAGGCNRQALTAEDAQGRNLFKTWCHAAGCEVREDAIGNLFARRAGRSPESPALLIGSHLDTQPTGGKFDGVLGVLAGLEVMRTLNDRGIETDAPIDLAVWTNEEGARFPPAMMGSGVWAGAFDLETTWQTTDQNGVTLKDALDRIDASGSHPCEPFPIKGAFELHIEQGPILEAQGKEIGIVTGVQGIRWYDVRLEGKACHAGPTPMEDRADPMMVLGRLLDGAFNLAAEYAPWARITFGELHAEPGSRNTVPETVRTTIDLRHPDQAMLDDLDVKLRWLIDGISGTSIGAPVSAHISEIWHSPAVNFDPVCVGSIKEAVATQGYSSMEMVSGAGHDSVYVARVAPTAMIFVPCKDGLSHNEAESITIDQAGIGADVLLATLLHHDTA